MMNLKKTPHAESPHHRQCAFLVLWVLNCTIVCQKTKKTDKNSIVPSPENRSYALVKK